MKKFCDYQKLIINFHNIYYEIISSYLPHKPLEHVLGQEAQAGTFL